MPRNSNGVYTLPQSDVVQATTISSTVVNSDFSDIASTVTVTMATTGVSTMTGQLALAQGLVTTPSLTYGAYPTTGFYLSNVTTNEVSYALTGVQKFIFSSSAITSGLSIIDNNSNAIYGMPAGTISPYPGSTAPTNWLLCFGQAVSRTTYSALFSALSTTYGAGDGSTTFNLPDMRGRIPYGVDNMGGSAANRITSSGSGVSGTTVGATGGVQSQTIAQANLPNYTWGKTDPSHLHTFTQSTNAHAAAGGTGGVNSLAATGGASTESDPDNVSFTSGGSGSNTALMNPTLILTYIIYAGV